MKKTFLFVGVFSLLFSCVDDNEPEIDCRLFDPIFPTLFIKFVDQSGNNLIENGTINTDSLRVMGSFPNVGIAFVQENEFAMPDADIRKLDNTIELSLTDQVQYQYSVYFSQTDSVVVDVSAELTKIPCNISYYTPKGVRFKDTDVELEEVPPLQFLAVLEIQ
jgi:hypothetical protein